MIEAVIRASLRNRGLVLVAALLLTIAGLLNLRTMPVDALPDLSDVQVIIRTPFAGQAPQVVEDQVTYPLTTAMLSVPGAETVRGYSFFGDSYVYIIFDDDTDPYWARSRVLEYLSQVSSRLPPGVTPALGPDATGVGWVYEYALVDRTNQRDLSQLRAIQDWFLKYELQTVAGVSEVASVGGMVKQYQVIVDPDRLSAYGLTLSAVNQAIRTGNQEVGGSVIEMAETEFMVRATGYVEGLEDLRAIPLKVTQDGTAVLLGDVAQVQTGPQLRRGVADLNGEGEVAGGIIVMRSGENAQATIAAVKQRLAELQGSLPDGVEVVPTYDRSELIGRSVDNLYTKLLEEFAVVAFICALFLFHLRSSLVAIATLPLGILAALLIMRGQDLNANIMSLGGIAIAIGAMVDGAIVMIENVHKHLEHDPEKAKTDRWGVIAKASAEVGPALFFSLLIITSSFLPVFTLEAQEGRLFAPLAFTKTYAMAAAAILSITVVPVLMGYLIRGKIMPENRNPVNRLLSWIYRPVIRLVMRAPWVMVAAGILVMTSAIWPLSRLGSEFMPPLDEGDWMYMPTTRPGLSIGEATQLLQQTDRLIKSVPEVAQVFGKIGRADTATDPAPLSMIETIIRFKPESEWREGMTIESIREEIQRTVDLPGVTNAWVMPIKTRIDMLATGIKTPVGIKIGGPDLPVIQSVGADIEALLPQVQGTASVFAERVAGGRYVTVDIDRAAAARHGLNINDVQAVISSAIGGMNVSETIEGLERFPINVRYPQEVRGSIDTIRDLPVLTSEGERIRLGDVAQIEIEDGPPMIKSENSRPTGWVYVDIAERDIGSYVQAAQQHLAENLELPAGYSLTWSGQYEYMERAKERLTLVVPLTLLIIAFLLYLAFRRLGEVLIIMATLPMAIAGSSWLLWWLAFDLSVAVAVGFIALAGVAVEIGVIMLIYLNQYRARYLEQAQENGGASVEGLREAIAAGALQRLRPIVMTVAAITAGLLPIMQGHGTGGEIMKRIAAPMVGGMISTLVLTLLVLPAVYFLWQKWLLRAQLHK
ncbi:cation transporter [Pseudohongiella nitratireducens]|uniref:Cation transporter n=1 Tax=Pseudohongiella nitratireducens TaxID=1768907 RepID=A0A917GII9_9GAMM|nr:CusA/CzcA family heavy metal efflux RND transporter [Pseudohongiella nitratireducens]GGG47134.1 cation transporter [Pseudohongiella nitratireducens]